MIGGREAPCGTVAGYARHKRFGEEPCDACRAKHNEYHREYARRRRRLGLTTSEAADPVACARAPERTVRPPGEPVYADTYIEQLARVPVPATVPDAHRRVALLACGDAVADIELADPRQRADAVARARLVLDALGLTGDTSWRPSPGTRKQSGARVMHGTRSAVDEHQAAGTALCGPCQRWADVQSRRTGA